MADRTHPALTERQFRIHMARVYLAQARVWRLRAYGNAINPWQAAEFIRAFAEARGLMLDAARVAA